MGPLRRGLNSSVRRSKAIGKRLNGFARHPADVFQDAHEGLAEHRTGFHAGKAAKLINLSILLCVRPALETGSFTCTLKELRELAVHYNCYDSPNFSKNLKANKNYSKPREKGGDLELSGPGLKKAGDLIKAIATASA